MCPVQLCAPVVKMQEKLCLESLQGQGQLLDSEVCGECGMVTMIERLYDGGEEVEDGEGGGDGHFPVEEGQVVLRKLVETRPDQHAL